MSEGLEEKGLKQVSRLDDFEMDQVEELESESLDDVNGGEKTGATLQSNCGC